MKAIATTSILFVAAAHLGFFVLEMFFWNHPFGRVLFSMTAEQSATTAVLAANQGLYNGFLAAGLVWGMTARKPDVTMFFLICVLVAGIFGGISASPSIFLVQALPASIAIAAQYLARDSSQL